MSSKLDRQINNQITLQIEAKLDKKNLGIMKDIYTVYVPSEKTKLNITTNLERLKMLVTTFKVSDKVLNKSMSILAGSIKLNPITVSGDFVVVLLEGIEAGFGFTEPVEELIIYQANRGGNQ